MNDGYAEDVSNALQSIADTLENKDDVRLNLAGQIVAGMMSSGIFFNVTRIPLSNVEFSIPEKEIALAAMGLADELIRLNRVT